MSRLPSLSPEEMDADQRRVYEQIAGGPRKGFRGPFHALIHSPECAECVGRTGEVLRYRGVLPPRLREMAVLIVTRFWGAQYAWYAHEPHARKEGLGGDVIAALLERRRPDAMGPEEAAVYDFCTELQEKHSVGEAAYRAAADRFGERGLVELTVLLGHYTMVSMTLNAFELPVPEGAEPPFSD